MFLIGRQLVRASAHLHLRGTFSHSARSSTTAAALPDDGKTLFDFINASRTGAEPLVSSPPTTSNRTTRTVHIETYGCQMNSNDSEVVLAVLTQAGFTSTPIPETADVILLNTCAIRENAESKVWARLGYFKNLKAGQHRHKARVPSIPAGHKGPVVGVLGCMAERLKHRLLEDEKLVDVVAGPDSYRDLPRLIDIVTGRSNNLNIENDNGQGNCASATAAGVGRQGRGPRQSITKGRERLSAINVQLSADETYADIVPVRPAGAVSAYLSIMRGCNNMCSFCVVPFTRGRERSRPLHSIVDEVRMLSDKGVKEIILLGQNVNSYTDFTSSPSHPQQHDDDPFAAHYARGFKSVYKPRRSGAAAFADLLAAVATVNPELRIRFTSPHPKDFSDDVLHVIATHPNVGTQLHMPAQSGSTAVLASMQRGYTREAYDELVAHVRASLPGVALSTDMITGFCGETEADHAASVDLMRHVRYESAFLFAYSERSPTAASKHLVDDVAEEVKGRRLRELIHAYRAGLADAAAEEVGRRHLVLVEGPSRRDPAFWTGRTDTYKRVVFPATPVPASYHGSVAQGSQGSTDKEQPMVEVKAGEYVAVEVEGGRGGSLVARAVARTSIAEFVGVHGSAVPLEKYSPV